MSNTYTKNECWVCGQIISCNGLATAAHLKMHIREGYLIQTRWNPNDYAITDKPFNKEEYQKAHPKRSYTHDDYFPSDELRAKKAQEKRWLREMEEA